MLVLLRSFFYTPDTSFSDEFSLTLPMLVLVSSFVYTLGTSFSEEFPVDS